MKQYFTQLFRYTTLTNWQKLLVTKTHSLLVLVLLDSTYLVQRGKEDKFVLDSRSNHQVMTIVAVIIKLVEFCVLEN